MTTRLQRIRKERGWSQERLIVELERYAKRDAIDIATRSSLKVMISRWENAVLLPGDKYLPLLREVYHATDDDLGFAAHRDKASPLTALPTTPKRLTNGAETLLWLTGLFDQHIQAEPFMGPQLLLPSVQPQMDIIKALCRASSSQIRNDAYQVGMRFAEFCGWLYQDAGDMKSAAYWTSQALDYAQMDGDDLMASYVLMRKANIAAEAGNPGHSVGLADAALRPGSILPPRVRAASLRVKATGAAMLGERTMFAQAIEEANECAAAGAQVDEPDDPARYCTPSYVQMEEATSLVRLGDPQAALRIFEHGLIEWPAIQRRDRGLCLARMATAHAMTGDHERALSAGSEAAAIAYETGSSRISAEIESLRGELAHQLKTGVLSELDRAIAGAQPQGVD